ncbi:Sacs protein [Pelomyxa schiedti]|nr:Sacs protein [Pelomyxa schiedti]
MTSSNHVGLGSLARSNSEVSRQYVLSNTTTVQEPLPPPMPAATPSASPAASGSPSSPSSPPPSLLSRRRTVFSSLRGSASPTPSCASLSSSAAEQASASSPSLQSSSPPSSYSGRSSSFCTGGAPGSPSAPTRARASASPEPAKSRALASSSSTASSSGYGYGPGGGHGYGGRVGLLYDRERFEQTSHVLDTLRTIVNNYSGDVGILLELLQNADDAGAREVRFLLDTNTFTCTLPESSGFPSVSHMKPWSGPALYAYNDAVFTPQDYENISRIASMGKQHDLTKTGRYGQGFNSVYHITDVPCWISGGNIVFSDPHGLYVDPPRRGAIIPLSMARERPEQFKMFNVFGDIFADISPGKPMFYPGTLFRFPLRPLALVSNSIIKKAEIQPSEIRSLFNEFAKTPANALLFLRSVKTIKLYLPESSIQFPWLSVSLQADDPLLACRQELKEKLVSLPEMQPLNTEILIKCTTKVNIDRNGFKSSENWAIYQLLGGKANILRQDDLSLKPLVGIALQTDPTSQYSGKIFCTLPLPISLNLPFHINGFFCMTSDRRSIALESHSGNFDKKIIWNKTLLTEMAAPLAIKMLLDLRDTFKDKIYQLLPTADTLHKDFLYKFYDLCWSSTEPPTLFPSGRRWVSASQGCFLSSETSLQVNSASMMTLLRNVVSSCLQLHILNGSECVTTAIQCHSPLSHLITQEKNLLSPKLIRNTLKHCWLTEELKSVLMEDALQNGFLIDYIMKDLNQSQPDEISQEFYDLPVFVTASKRLVRVGKQALVVATTEEASALGHSNELLHPKQATKNCQGLFTNNTLMPALSLKKLLTPEVFSSMIKSKLGTSTAPVRWNSKVITPQFIDWVWKNIISMGLLSQAELGTSSESAREQQLNSLFGAIPLIPTYNNFLAPLAHVSQVIWPMNLFSDKFLELLLELNCLVFDDSVGVHCTSAVSPLLSFSPHAHANSSENYLSIFLQILKDAPIKTLNAEKRDVLVEFIIEHFQPDNALTPPQVSALCKLPLWKNVKQTHVSILKPELTFIAEPKFRNPAVVAVLHRLTLLEATSPTHEQLLHNMGVKSLSFSEFVEVVLPFLLHKVHGHFTASLPKSPSLQIVIDNLTAISKDQVQDMLLAVVETYDIPPSICTIISAIPCIPTGADGTSRSATELFDPESPLFRELFPYPSQFFPSPSLSERMLKHLSFMQMNTVEKLTATGIIQCAARLASLQNSKLCLETLTSLVLNTTSIIIGPLLCNKQARNTLSECPFILCEQEDFPELGKFSYKPPVILAQPSMMINRADVCIAGTQRPSISSKYSPEDQAAIQQLFGKCDANSVLQHLQCLVEHFHSMPDIQSAAHMIHSSLKYINDVNPGLISKVFSKESRFIPLYSLGGQLELASPSMLCRNSECPPFVYELPFESKLYEPLLVALGDIADEPSDFQLSEGLTHLSKVLNGDPLPKKMKKRVMTALKKLAVEKVHHTPPLMLAEDNTLCLASECYIPDAPWLIPKIEPGTLKYVSKEHEAVARKLGCPRLSEVVVESVHEGSIQVSNDCPASVQCDIWLGRIHSVEFKDSLERLRVTQFRSTEAKSAQPEVPDISEFKIKIAHALPTILLLNGRDITFRSIQSTGSCDFFSSSENCLYLARGEDQFPWSIYLQIIARTIKVVFLSNQFEDTGPIQSLLQSEPESMQTMLDRLKVPRLVTPEHVAPKALSTQVLALVNSELSSINTPVESKETVTPTMEVVPTENRSESPRETPCLEPQESDSHEIITEENVQDQVVVDETQAMEMVQSEVILPSQESSSPKSPDHQLLEAQDAEEPQETSNTQTDSNCTILEGKLSDDELSHTPRDPDIPDSLVCPQPNGTPVDTDSTQSYVSGMKEVETSTQEAVTEVPQTCISDSMKTDPIDSDELRDEISEYEVDHPPLSDQVISTETSLDTTELKEIPSCDTIDSEIESAITPQTVVEPIAPLGPNEPETITYETAPSTETKETCFGTPDEAVNVECAELVSTDTSAVSDEQPACIISDASEPSEPCPLTSSPSLNGGETEKALEHLTEAPPTNIDLTEQTVLQEQPGLRTACETAFPTADETEPLAESLIPESSSTTLECGTTTELSTSEIVCPPHSTLDSSIEQLTLDGKDDTNAAPEKPTDTCSVTPVDTVTLTESPVLESPNLPTECKLPEVPLEAEDGTGEPSPHITPPDASTDTTQCEILSEPEANATSSFPEITADSEKMEPSVGTSILPVSETTESTEQTSLQEEYPLEQMPPTVSRDAIQDVLNTSVERGEQQDSEVTAEVPAEVSATESTEQVISEPVIATAEETVKTTQAPSNITAEPVQSITTVQEVILEEEKPLEPLEPELARDLNSLSEHCAMPPINLSDSIATIQPLDQQVLITTEEPETAKTTSDMALSAQIDSLIDNSSAETSATFVEPTATCTEPIQAPEAEEGSLCAVEPLMSPKETTEVNELPEIKTNAEPAATKTEPLEPTSTVDNDTLPPSAGTNTEPICPPVMPPLTSTVESSPTETVPPITLTAPQSELPASPGASESIDSPALLASILDVSAEAMSAFPPSVVPPTLNETSTVETFREPSAGKEFLPQDGTTFSSMPNDQSMGDPGQLPEATSYFHGEKPVNDYDYGEGYETQDDDIPINTGEQEQVKGSTILDLLQSATDEAIACHVGGKMGNTKVSEELCMHACVERDPGVELVKVGSVGGTSLWVPPSALQEDIAKNITGLKLFWSLLDMISRSIVGTPLGGDSRVHLFLEASDNLAFNWRGSLFFNVEFFQILHHNAKLATGGQEALQPSVFWYLTFCHELAHNVETKHNSKHNALMLSLASHKFTQFQSLSSDFLKSPTAKPEVSLSHRTLNAQPQPPESHNTASTKGQWVPLKEADNLLADLPWHRRSLAKSALEAQLRPDTSRSSLRTRPIITPVDENDPTLPTATSTTQSTVSNNPLID